MSTRTLLLTFAAVALVGCNSSPTPNDTTNTGALPSTVIQHETFQEWIDRWSAVEPPVEADTFTLVEQQQVVMDAAQTRTPAESELRPPKSDRYIYSPDRSRFVDVRAHAGEPDSSVMLYNRRGDKTLETIAFCGTPCTFDTAFWLDAERFVVLGQSEDMNDQGMASCTVASNPWTCNRRLTIDYYDIATGLRRRYVSSPHRFPRNPYEGTGQSMSR